MAENDKLREPQRAPLQAPVRRKLRAILVGFLSIALFATFVGLGIWQIERRAWKLDLIAAVEERATAEPVQAPGPSRWPSLSFEGDEYRRLALTGRFLDGSSVLAQATTDYGLGYWLMTPLSTERGFTVIVNRGFVPSRDVAHGIVPPSDDVTLSGLLRMSEPGGGFLRSNDPAAGRWYSRDVTAIAVAEGIPGPIAPYFVDADASGGVQAVAEGEGRYPIGGLTVTRFRNSHLVYALTWFALAALTGLGAAIFYHRERKRLSDG